MTAKAPPHSPADEGAVLGSMMLDAEACEKAVELLRQDDFFEPRNSRIFQVIWDLNSQGVGVDVLSVSSELNKQNLLEEIGGGEYLTDLVSGVTTSAHVGFHCDQVRQYSTVRQLSAGCTEIVKKCLEHEDDSEDILDLAERTIYALSEKSRRINLEPVSSFIHDSIDALEKVYSKQAKVTGLQTGFPELDKVTSGLQPGNMVTLAARPGMGKTSLAIDIARHAAVHQGIPVAFYSLEMTKTEIFMRLLSAMTSIPLFNIRTGFFGPQKWMQITSASEKLAASPLYLDCSSFNMSSAGIRSSARRLAARLSREKRPLGLIVVDYLQLISGTGTKYKSRESEVAEISRTLKAISMDLNVPVLALSQLNRQTEELGRAGRPRLSDLRESGGIEQDSDLVMFIYREALYKANATEEEKAKTKLIIAKHRNGALCEIPFYFVKEQTRFYESEKQEEVLAG